MNQEMAVLIVSCRPENRKALLRVFDGLSINSYVAPTIRDAIEVLVSRSISMVFCEERLPDGPYSDLLTDARATWSESETQFVVMLCTGDWEEYLQAMRLGAQEVLRCPLLPTDIDLVLIQAMKRNQKRNELTKQWEPITQAH